jgi:endonuclease-8
MYKAEICFVAGLSPWTPVGDVPDLSALVALARRVLSANKDRAAQTTTGDTRRGRQLWVYARAGQPCRRCRTPIRRAAPDDPTGERSTYWCPSCQPGPEP